MNQLYSFSLFIVLLLIGCTSKTAPVEIDLTGHWHFYSDEVSHRVLTTMDIENKLVLLNKNSYSTPASGKYNIDEENRTIFKKAMHGQEAKVLYEFELDIDTLMMKDIENENTLKAIRRNVETCDFSSDYFLDKATKVELPILDKKEELKGFENLRILMGALKEGPTDSLVIEPNVSVYQRATKTRKRIFTMEDLPTINLFYGRSIIDESERDSIASVVYADKDVLLKDLKTLVDTQKSIVYTDMYLACQMKNPLNEYSHLTYLSLDDLQFAEPLKTVGDYVQSKELE